MQVSSDVLSWIKGLFQLLYGKNSMKYAHEGARHDLRITVNSLIFRKLKYLLQILTVLVNVDTYASQAEGISLLSAYGPRCPSGIWKAAHRAVGPIIILQSVRLLWEPPSGDARCRLAWGEKLMARLGWESSRRLCLCAVWWYTCLGLAVMRTPQSHGL